MSVKINARLLLYVDIFTTFHIYFAENYAAL